MSPWLIGHKTIIDGLALNRYWSRFYTDTNLTKYMASGDMDEKGYTMVSFSLLLRRKWACKSWNSSDISGIH